MTHAEGLVPLPDRVRGLAACRLVLAAAVVTGAFLSAGTSSAAQVAAGLVTAAYLALTAPTLLALRLRRGVSLAVVGAGLMLDGAYVAWAGYAVLGHATVLTGLVVLHTVAVTLVASFRTGLKVAMWHTLLLGAAVEVERLQLLTPLAPLDTRGLALLAGVVWLTVLATATFAAVNERELRQRSYDLASLARLSLRLEASMAPDGVGHTLVTAVCEEQFAPRAVVLRADGAEMTLLAGSGHRRPPAGSALDAVVRTALSEHRTLRVAELDPAADPWLSEVLPGARNLLVLGLHADGAVVGALVVEHGSRPGSRVQRRVVEALERCAAHAALALRTAVLLERERTAASTDALTGAATRRVLEAVLEREVATSVLTGQPVAVVMVDLDHFKRMNDTHGHQVGDDVLRAVAAAVQAVRRPQDLFARYGGEEFVLVLPGATMAGALQLAERVRATVAATRGIPPVTASLGVAVAPDHGTRSEDLVAAADAALYEAKRAGRDRVVAAGQQPVGAAPALDARA